MHDLSDETLMLRYGAGDGDAFDILYLRYKDAVYRFVRRQCRDRETAEDLFQEIWLGVVRGRCRYRVQAKFTTYLFTLARNRVIDYLRAQGRTIGADPSDQDPEQLAGEPHDEPAAQAHARGLIERSHALVHALPPAQREAILLYVEGLGLAEIAEIIAVSVETVRSRVRRALMRLRRELGEETL
jgi:RNA polymerase sigma-70 factor (ECF subfamily)